MEENVIREEITGFLPELAERLIWEEFFVSRNRGLNIGFHFPWIKDRKKIVCVTLYATTEFKEKVVATLIIKKHKIDSLGCIGLVGLVCVDKGFRGKGISNRLLNAAATYASGIAIRALVLWTNKPQVYKKIGFNEDFVDFFGRVCRKNCVTNDENNRKIINSNQINSSGVPAFAEEVIVFKTELASVVACKSRENFSLVDWSGDYEEIFLIIQQAFPESWLINVPKESEIIQKLENKGYSLELKVGSIRMIKVLNNFDHEIPYISMLNRI